MNRVILALLMVSSLYRPAVAAEAGTGTFNLFSDIDSEGTSLATHIAIIELELTNLEDILASGKLLERHRPLPVRKPVVAYATDSSVYFVINQDGVPQFLCYEWTAFEQRFYLSVHSEQYRDLKSKAISISKSIGPGHTIYLGSNFAYDYGTISVSNLFLDLEEYGSDLIVGVVLTSTAIPQNITEDIFAEMGPVIPPLKIPSESLNESNAASSEALSSTPFKSTRDHLRRSCRQSAPYIEAVLEEEVMEEPLEPASGRTDRISKQCPFCKKILHGRPWGLNRHIQGVHLKFKQFECSSCEARFASRQTLQRHQKGNCKRKRVD